MEAGESDRELGDILVRQGVLPRERVEECLLEIEALRAAGAAPVPSLRELLAQRGLLPAAAPAAPTPKLGSGRFQPPRELPADVRAALDDPKNDAGPFILIRLLGKGGMGEVHLAWEKALARYVAVKFIRGRGAEDYARFVREARIVAKLHHPHIAPVYELGERDGEPYIVMHYVPGVTLDRARLDLRATVRAVLDAAAALDFAHRHGIIHRDVKPNNIMVDDGHIYVMDFGLARHHEVDSSVSQSGVVVGTPQYMSPEQAMGRTREVGPRSDVYSLGATLYALLTGRPPFEGETIFELLHKIVAEDPPPPRRFNPDVPRDLETVILRALDKDPARRYATAADLREDLQRFLSDEPILARPASFTYRVRKRLAKRKALVAVVSAGVAIVAFLTAGFAIRLANERAAAGEREAALKSLGEAWLGIFLAREDLRSEGVPPSQSLDRIRAGVDQVGKIIERHPGQAQGYFVRARGWLYLDELDRAEEDLQRAIERDSAAGPALALLARVKMERHAKLRYGPPELRDERLAGAEPLLREAEDLLLRESRVPSAEAWGLPRTPEDDVAATLARALAAGARAKNWSATAKLLEEENSRRPSEEFCNWLGNYEKDPARRLAWFDRALQRMRHHAKSWLDRGTANVQLKNLEAAIEDFGRALAINPRLSPAYFNRGNARLAAGNSAGAIEDYTRALELDPRDADSLMNRGNARRAAGRLDEAFQDYDRAIELRPDHALAHTNRGVARRLKGDLEGATADHSRAIQLNPKLALAYVNRGNRRLEDGDLAGALEDYGRAIDIHPAFAGAWNNRGIARRMGGDAQGALKDHDRAIELDPRMAEAYSARGAARQLAGDPKGARTDFDRAIELNPRYAWAHNARGTLRQAEGDADGALADYSKAIELDAAAVPEAHFNRALLRQSRGDAAGAMQDLARAIEIQPRYADALACRGMLREQLARREPSKELELLSGAAEDLQAALAAAPAPWRYQSVCEKGLARIRRRLEELKRGQ